jgi:hypothetical protein
VQAVVGDFNVEIDSEACALLRDRGYISAFDQTPPCNVQPFAALNEAAVAEPAVVRVRHDSSASSVLSNDDESEEGSIGGGGADMQVESSPPLRPRWVSHRTHRQEELGVDHIFLRSLLGPEWEMVARDTCVMPVQEPCSTWSLGFTISDHRPVRATLEMRRR